MSRGAHRAPRRAARTSRLPAATLAVLLAVGLVLGTQGTLAFWSDRATVTGGQLSSGTLDLTVDGAQGNPTPYAKTSLTMTGMLPGESAAEVLTVRNAGSAPFTWTATASTAGGLGPHLVVTMSLGGTASPDDTTYPRTETCAGGTPVASGTTSTRLAAGTAGLAGQVLCVQVSLPTSTGNAAQGQPTGSVTVRLDATQAAS